MKETNNNTVILDKIQSLVKSINEIHSVYSDFYFNKYLQDSEIFNLSKTITNIPLNYILKYRLNLHENINDYLIQYDNKINIKYWYRVKTNESIINKIERYNENEDRYPLNNWLNDIFGARIILNDKDFNFLYNSGILNEWKEKFGLKNWYLREKEGYRGIHIYFKNRNNRYFPWELQIWSKSDVDANIENHRKYKRNFV